MALDRSDQPLDSLTVSFIGSSVGLALGVRSNVGRRDRAGLASSHLDFALKIVY